MHGHRCKYPCEALGDRFAISTANYKKNYVVFLDNSYHLLKIPLVLVLYVNLSIFSLFGQPSLLSKHIIPDFYTWAIKCSNKAIRRNW